MATSAELPKWSVDKFFPSLDSDEYRAEFDSLSRVLLALRTKLNELTLIPTTTKQVESKDTPRAQHAIDPADVESVMSLYNQCLAQSKLLRSYVYSFVSTDSRNELALARQSELSQPLTELSRLSTELTAWTGTLPIDELCQKSESCNDHRYPLKRAAFLSSKLMSSAEEALANDLFDAGLGAWGRLHSSFTSQLDVDVNGTTLSMSGVRNLAYDPDGAVRLAGYEAELKAWKANSLPLAQSMNSIKRQTSLLAKRRGWDSLLDDSLYSCSMDRSSLEAMLDAATDAFPSFRNYLKAKARLLGRPGSLPFYDLFAPVGQESDWSYDRAKSFIVEKFSGYSQKLAALAQRSFDENWIDVGPRTGKQDGAFCMGMQKEESRILMNFKPSFGSVSTLAHELGHAYHNLCLADCTGLQRVIPMTLAETASIFCETIIKRAALDECSGSERIGILEASLQGTCQTVVDISSRFLFESEVVDRREQRELSESELCDAMMRAQLATYGDGLDSEFLHPYMWAAKPHYYSQRAFYNFPYMFGLLFSLGLYATYKNSPNGFQQRYDDLLSETGRDTATNLAKRFGIDIQKKEFWESSLNVVKADIDEFVALVG